MDHVGLKKVHLVGYSLGAELCLNVAIRHPERVKSLCIGGSGWSDAEQAILYQSFGDCCYKLPGMPCGANVICWSRAVWYPCCCPLCCSLLHCCPLCC